MRYKELVQACDRLVEETMKEFDGLSEEEQEKDFEKICDLVWRIEKLKEVGNGAVH